MLLSFLAEEDAWHDNGVAVPWAILCLYKSTHLQQKRKLPGTLFLSGHRVGNSRLNNFDIQRALKKNMSFVVCFSFISHSDRTYNITHKRLLRTTGITFVMLIYKNIFWRILTVEINTFFFELNVIFVMICLHWSGNIMYCMVRPLGEYCGCANDISQMWGPKFLLRSITYTRIRFINICFIYG